MKDTHYNVPKLFALVIKVLSNNDYYENVSGTYIYKEDDDKFYYVVTAFNKSTEQNKKLMIMDDADLWLVEENNFMKFFDFYSHVL